MDRREHSSPVIIVNEATAMARELCEGLAELAERIDRELAEGFAECLVALHAEIVGIRRGIARLLWFRRVEPVLSFQPILPAFFIGRLARGPPSSFRLEPTAGPARRRRRAVF